MVLVLALEVALSSTHAENEDVTAEKKRRVAEACACWMRSELLWNGVDQRKSKKGEIEISGVADVSDSRLG